MKKLVIIIISLLCVNVAFARKDNKVKTDVKEVAELSKSVTRLENGGIRFHIEDKDAPVTPLKQISGRDCWEKILRESAGSA